MSADPAPSRLPRSATLRFTDLGLPEPLLRALADVGYEIAFADPGRDHPAAAAGPRRARPGADRHRQDRRLRAADPGAHRPRRSTKPQALVLAPTRELAIQVAEAFQNYAAHLPGFHVLPIYGGQSYGPQLQRAQARRARRRRHAGPRDRPPRAAARSTCRS